MKATTHTSNTGRRIAFYLLLAIVPLLVTAGFYLTNSAQRKIKHAYYANADAVSAFVSRGLELEKENLNHYLEFWTSNPSFELAFESASVFGDVSSMGQRAEQVLAKLNLDRLEVADKSGKALASLRRNPAAAPKSRKSFPSFKAVIEEGRSFSGIQTDDQGLWVFSVAPVRINQAVAGAAEFSTHIDANYLQPIRELAHADIVVVRDNKVAAANPPALAEFKPDAGLLSQAKAKKRNGYALVESGKRAYLAVYSPLKDVDDGNTSATIIVLLDAQEYQTAMIHAARSWTLTIGVLSLVVVLVAFFVGRTIDGINRTLVEARDYTDGIIKSMADALIVVQANWTIQSVNQATLKLLGYAESELIGEPIERVLQTSQIGQPFVLNDAVRKESLNGVEVTGRTKSGASVSMNFSASALRDRHGTMTGWVCVAQDITERKRAECELEKVQKQLLLASREAGMSEVATSVLHNVGNVLNSINVSSTMVTDSMRKSKAANLGKVVTLLDSHTTDLGNFLTTDPKGQQVPAYLRELNIHIAHEQEKVVTEMESLRKNIDHIKDIVAMQQNYAKVFGVTETVTIVDLVEDALRMNAGALVQHDVEIVRDFQEVPPISIEKHKVLQVLVNLIRNAKYACDESGRKDKSMTIRVANSEGRIKISIIDNGVGIPPENLTRIFNHGFTTRKDGHGFGLHSGALAAKELGGSLTGHSDGPGLGATFTIELPLPRAEISNGDDRNQLIPPSPCSDSMSAEGIERTSGGLPRAYFAASRKGAIQHEFKSESSLN